MKLSEKLFGTPPFKPSTFRPANYFCEKKTINCQANMPLGSVQKHFASSYGIIQID